MNKESDFSSPGAGLYRRPYPNERPYSASNRPDHVVATYSNALGLFLNDDALPYPSPRPLAHLDNHTRRAPLVAVNPNYHTRSRKKVRFATGWVEHSKYVPHGYIEEVPADDHTMHLTEQHPLYANSLHISVPECTEPLPPLTTPPPRPELRLRSLPSSPLEGQFADQQSAAAVQPNVYGSLSVREQASKLVEGVLASAVGATDRICLFFRPIGMFFDLHIELFTLIKASLCSILQTLEGRHKISMDEWAGASSSWHQKDTDRLASLNRTLAKYLKLTGSILLSIQPDLVLSKLQGYEKKFSELARKISSSCERFRVQSLHTRLAEVHLVAHQHRISASCSEGAVFGAWPVEHQASRMRSRRGSATM